MKWNGVAKVQKSAGTRNRAWLPWQPTLSGTADNFTGLDQPVDCT